MLLLKVVVMFNESLTWQVELFFCEIENNFSTTLPPMVLRTATLKKELGNNF